MLKTKKGRMWIRSSVKLLSPAEEAQRLRKKRKAENSRLMEMEKRQKQRLEEIRELQKKDEEIIHLKEKLRVEVRKELDKMEGRYRDMASLLRGLGSSAFSRLGGHKFGRDGGGGRSERVGNCCACFIKRSGTSESYAIQLRLSATAESSVIQVSPPVTQVDGG
ncbi:hypothetical protein COCNU_scaffold001948G000010 [Cocos nucifera]|nr:hypothetical protein [Cocos nucifera]